MHSNGNSVWEVIHSAIAIEKGIKPIMGGWLANSQTNPGSLHKNWPNKTAVWFQPEVVIWK